MPTILLQQSLFPFTTPVAGLRGLHYNYFWIIIFEIHRSYFRENFVSCFSTEAVAQRCSVKKVLLQILRQFPGKHLCQSLFFNKFFFLFSKKETLAEVFSCEFCEICKSTFSIERLRWVLLFLHHTEAIVI